MRSFWPALAVNPASAPSVEQWGRGRPEHPARESPSRREREPLTMLLRRAGHGQEKVLEWTRLCVVRRRHGVGQPLRPQSKRQPVVELPRLRLPLPERTGSDRDELLSPHGFVDRAYSVFLLRCVSLLRTYSLLQPGFSVRPSPLGPACDPEAVSHLRAVPFRGVNEGTSPRAHPRPSLLLRLPLRRALPGTSHRGLPRWWSGGSRADGGARPARVPSELERPHSPCKASDHLGP